MMYIPHNLYMYLFYIHLSKTIVSQIIYDCAMFKYMKTAREVQTIRRERFESLK